jgi:TolA-binding protein
MLTPQKKIHRKEIKEDALVTWYFRITRWIAPYRRYFNIGGVVVLAAVALSVLMTSSKKNAEANAQGKLGVAEQSYFLNDYGRLIQDMKPILNKYPGTRAAGMAAFYLANAYFAQGNYGEAETFFKLYADKYADDPMLTASSLAGLAQVAESKNETAKAAVLYEKAGRKYKNSFAAPFYLKEAVRCYAQTGNKAAAENLLERIEKKYPGNSLKEEVRFLAESM